MISVIAPCLNEEKHLPMFLKSLVRQTLEDFEVVIIDGGSHDKSVDVIDSFSYLLDIKVYVDKRRNLGYIRNLGASYASHSLMLHTSVDTYLETELLEKIVNYYRQHPELISLAGRTYPLGTSILAHLGYQVFDFLRFIFTCSPMPIRKYRPSGNFTSCQSSIFREIGGFPEVTVNEDGLFGQQLDKFAISNHKSVVFHLGLWIGHHVKKFEQMGGVNAIFFYFYTLRNLFPMLNRFLKPIEYKASLVFTRQKISKQGFFHRFLAWL